MKVVIKIEMLMSMIEVVEAFIHLPEYIVKDLIQKLYDFHIYERTVLYVADYKIEEQEVKIGVAFMNENRIFLESPVLTGSFQKDFFDSAFEQIRKVFKLSSELDLYPALLKGAVLVIGRGRRELHFNRKKLTELITENS